MSTYVLMRVLESVPERYDAGMRLLTFGSIDRSYDRLAQYVAAGARVLDIGCGTGALTLRAAGRGGRVKGIDPAVGMLEVAARRATQAGLRDCVEFEEEGVALLDAEATASYDVVMSGLCFSELSDDEISFALDQIRRLLRPGGLLLLADEVRPRNLAKRIALGLLRAPLSAVVSVVAGRTSHAVEHLPERVSDAGFELQSSETSSFGSLCEIVARKPEDATA